MMALLNVICNVHDGLIECDVSNVHGLGDCDVCKTYDSLLECEVYNVHCGLVKYEGLSAIFMMAWLSVMSAS
jgi:hypothetical protein